MRTYSNFLLFEEVLLDLPTTSSILKQSFSTLFSPIVDIVENDCGTFLGKSVPVFFDIEGLIELATDLPIDRTRITTLLSQGIYQVKTRSQYSCNSEGGICKKCYLSDVVNRNKTVSVGDKVVISPRYPYQKDLITGDGTNKYSLSETADNYDAIVVFQNGYIITEPHFVASDLLTFATNKSPSDHYLVYFVKESANPFLGYLAQSYSGSVLGLNPLPTETPVIKPSLYSKLLSEGYLRAIQQELENFKDIPYTTLTYLDTVSDPLEKALLIYYLYAVYGSLN